MRTSLCTRLKILPLVLCLMGSLWGCSDSPQASHAGRALAPDFQLEGLDGGEVRLSDYRGKVVMLHFWATWCPPCTAAIPHEKELQERYGEDGFVVIGLSMDRDPEDVREFLEKSPVNYPVALVDKPTRAAYGGVPTVPLTILVDRDGIIRKQQIGFTVEDVASLERRITRLLEEG